MDKGDQTLTPRKIHNVKDWEQRHAGRQGLPATDTVQDWEQMHAGRQDLNVAYGRVIRK